MKLADFFILFYSIFQIIRKIFCKIKKLSYINFHMDLVTWSVWSMTLWPWAKQVTWQKLYVGIVNKICKINLGFIWINSDRKFGLDQSDTGLIRIDLDWKLGFGLVRIHSDWCLGINRIKSDWLLTVFIKRDKKRFSDWFGMIRIGSDTDIGMNWNSSYWLGMNFNPILLPGYSFHTLLFIIS